jgi:hypothetical protein
VDVLLSDAEARVLGALIEKEMTTPDYYPLTLNALTHACNQTTNRAPVVHYDETAVMDAIESLRRKNLVHQIKRSDSRVIKYRHVADETLSLDAREVAVMCVLMLRGPQTLGEIKTRAARLFDFPSLEETEATLNALIARPLPPAARLARRPGQKEVRYAHLLSGEVTFDAPDAPAAPAHSDPERIDALEARVEELSGAVETLRAQLQEFKKAFE